MSNRFICLFAGMIGLSLGAMEITSDYTVVTGKNPGITEAKGNELLVRYLGEIFGKKPERISEKEFSGKKRAIYVGSTDYARKHGLNPECFGDEEWLVKAMPDGNLMITGGRKRGSLYGVYEFLELAGCRYFSVGEKYIPKLKSIHVADTLVHRGAPAMESRYTFLGFTGMVPRELFSWNKQNRDAAPDNVHGEFFNARQWGHCNTYYILGKGFPAECFSLGKNGKRQIAKDGNGPGQFCFTSPLARKMLKAELDRRIAADRKKTQAGGYDPIGMWVLAQNDTEDRCFCPECLALEKKYGSYSGVLLDFTNDIASAFPETNFETHAYQWGEKAPKRGIRAAKNVYVQIAYLGYEWSGSNDTMKPLTHPVNRQKLKEIREWKDFLDNYSVWDYLVVGKLGMPTPYTVIPAMIGNFRVYGQLGVKRYFSELEIASAGKAVFAMSFHDLTLYLNMKLMENPFRDTDALLSDYFEKYYGQAAKPMRELFDLLVRRQTESGQSLGKYPPRQWKHADDDFLNAADQLLDQAEKAVSGDEARLRRVGFERLQIDNMRLLKLPRGSKAALPLVERLKKNYRAAVDRFIVAPDRQKTLDIIYRKLDVRLNPLPVPAELPADRTEQRIVGFGGFHGMMINDPDAFEGKAVHSTRIPEENHRKHLPQLGIFALGQHKDVLRRVIQLKEIPPDGKYHLYHLGRIKPGSYLHLEGWAHYSWHLRFPLEMPEAQSEYDVYASLKLIGPAYVPGSEGPSDFRIDRVFFVRAESPLPKGFDPEKCIVRMPPSTPGFHGERISDPEAAGRTAVRLTGKPERHQKPLSLGIFDLSRKRDAVKFVFKPNMIPQDEKYHLYKIGTLWKGHSGKLAGWIHWSWLLQFPADKLDPGKEYDIHVSLKLCGPAYVPGSKAPSSVTCDKVIFVEK